MTKSDICHNKQSLCIEIDTGHQELQSIVQARHGKDHHPWEEETRRTERLDQQAEIVERALPTRTVIPPRVPTRRRTSHGRRVGRYCEDRGLQTDHEVGAKNEFYARRLKLTNPTSKVLHLV